MSFFDDKVEPQDDKPVETPEKIKIGDEEFDPSELQDLVGKGKFAKEVEEKYNTKLDKVWPEYTKVTQELKSLREEKENWTKQQEQQLDRRPQSELSEAELAQQAKLQAKKLGLVTVDDIDTFVTQKVQTIQKANEMLDQCNNLAKEFDGKDGRPKFDTGEVLEYMKESGVQDPRIAYKLKFEDQLDKWKESQLSAAKKKGLYTEDGSGGNHEPPSVKLSKDNLGEAIREALNPRIED